MATATARTSTRVVRPTVAGVVVRITDVAVARLVRRRQVVSAVVRSGVAAIDVGIGFIYWVCRRIEVAVGTGAAFAELVGRNPNGSNIGIDLSQKMLAKAKKRLQALPEGNHSLDIASAFDLPAENDSIDLLMNNYMFDLIAYQEMDKVLIEFSRVLKPDGLLLLIPIFPRHVSAPEICHSVLGYDVEMFQSVTPTAAESAVNHALPAW